MNSRRAQSGNVFFALFGAVGMVGVLGAATMSVMKGPVRTMQIVTKNTVAENAMIAAGRLSIVASADCDTDGVKEPPEWAATGTGAAPTGGGFLPSSVGAARQDPWGNTYGYCAWDHGPTQDDVACGGPSQKRATGDASATPNGIVLAVISSGSDRIFQTTCGDHDTYVNKPAGSDDLVQEYTYNEARDLAGGLWQEVGAEGAQIARDLQVYSPDNPTTQIFGVDSATDPTKPSIKVDFIQKLTPAKLGVEFLSNIVLGDNWLSGDGGDEGLKISPTGQVMIGGPSGALYLEPRDGSGDSWAVYNQTGDSLRIWRTTGSDAMTVLQNGNVGIGTNDPQQKLDVAGNIRAVGSLMPTAPNLLTASAQNFGAILRNDNNNLLFLLTNLGEEEGAWNDLRPLTIQKSTGYVGIGTSSPTHQLTVDGATRIDYNENYDVWIQGGSATSGYARNLAILGRKTDDTLIINHGGEYTGGTIIYGPVRIYNGALDMGSEGITSSAGTIRDGDGGWVRTYGNTGWYNGTHGGGWTMTDSTWLRAHNGRGILTGGPLNIGGNSTLGGNVEVGGTMTFNGTTIIRSSSNTQGMLLYAGGAANSGAGLQLYGNGNAGAGKAYIQTRAGTAGAGNSAIIFRNNVDDNWNTLTTMWTNGNMTVYGAAKTCAIGNGTGATNCTSDARLKKDVVTLQDPLKILEASRGVRYHWNEKSGKDMKPEYLGVIAQEVQAVLPELVVEEEGSKEGYLMVSLEGFVPVLIEGVKALKKENDAMRARLDALEQAQRNHSKDCQSLQ